MRDSIVGARSARRHAVSIVTVLALTFGWLLVGSPAAVADGPTTFTNAAAIAIPATGSADQMGPAGPYPSDIAVSGLAGAVSKVTVTFHGLTHSTVNDIDAMVVSPTGQNLVVLSDVGDPATLAFANNATLTFDDAAAASVPTGNIPTGTYKPTNIDNGADSFPAPAPAPSSQTTLAGAFTGINPNGTWHLYALDDTSGDTGNMAGGWSITVTTDVAAVATTTTVTTSDATTTTGDPVTFTASVKAGATPVTSGSVQFADGATALGSPVTLNGSGQATLTTSALAEGTHAILATYSGATGFLTSNGTVSQRVDNATVVTGDTFCNTGAITVPALGASTPYPSHVTVSGLTGQVVKVTASLKGLSHQAPLDLDILLAGPTPSTNLLIMSDAGGQSPVSNLNLTFDDAAAGGVPVPAVSGTYTPTNSDDGSSDTFPAPAPPPSSATTLATFAGASGNGQWSLWVVDDASGDSGSIASGWCLTIVSQAPTTTVLTSVPNPSTHGSAVTLTATVTSAGSPVTTGTVQFSDGATPLGSPVAVAADGSATLTTSALTTGSHSLTATYGGAGTLATSSGSVTQVVNKAATATALASDTNPANVGDPVRFTATVTSAGSPVSTGTVQFSDGATPLGAAVPVGPDGAATLTTSALTAGTHTITAAYSGDANLATSSDSLAQVVNALTTTTTLTSTPNPSTFGATVTLTATVTSGGSPVSTGTVQFADGATPLGAAVTVAADGTATLTTSALTVGSHALSAAYSGTATYAASTGSTSQVVDQAATTTTLTSAPNPSTFGATVTLTATVTSAGSPLTTGSVQFSDGATVLGAPVTVAADGTATLTASALTVGSHALSATYSGTVTYAASTGTATQVVDKASTTTTLTSSPNPSTLGATVTVTATVTSGGSPVGTGTVQFADGATALGAAVTVAPDGTATLTTSALTVGSHPLTATFSGTDNLTDSSDSLTQVVNALTTTTTLTATPNPSAFGQTVTLTATVTSGGSPLTTGTVQFSDGATLLGAPVAVAADGTATVTTSALTVGSHPLSAAYGGTATYAASTATATQVVDRAATTTTLTSAPNPSTLGATVTLTATVTSGGSPVTTGTVQFADGATLLGAPVTVAAGGTATLTTSALTVGSHPLTAAYSGSDTLTDSSDALTQVVDKAPTATSLASDTNPSTLGATVTLAATVTSGGSPVSTGTVQFSDGATPLGAAVTVGADGTATLTTSALTAGTHPLTAAYSGDANLAASSDTLQQVVNALTTATTVTSTPNPSAFGQAVTFTATVTSTGAPVGEGDIMFAVDGSPQPAVTVAADGTATLSTSALSAGSHTITAGYSGTATYAASLSNRVTQGVRPVADAGGPYLVAEGGSVTLDASGSSAGATYAWDLNGDADFTDATGAAPTLTWAQLESLGIHDGPADHTVTVQVTIGSLVSTATATLGVTNTAPTAVITGSLMATVGAPFTVKLGANDPSSADRAAMFTYTVDWGDGSAVVTLTGPADPPVTHTYASAGSFSASFTATDKDGGTGDPTGVQVVAAAAAITTSPSTTPSPTQSTPGLAFTGANILTPLLLGALLVVVGAACLLLTRRRTSRHN